MFEAYKVGVTLSLTNHVSAALKLLSKDFVGLHGQVGGLQKALDSLQRNGRAAGLAMREAFSIASPITYAISQAAKLQKEMIGIQLTTRGTTAEMDSLRSVIEGVAGKTVFSNIDVAKMGKTIAAGTGFNASQLSSLLPEYAKFADVQYLLKGTSYDQSVKDAVRLAHTAQHYDPESLRSYLDLLNKASLIIPGGLGEVGHALKYSQGMAKTALGIDDSNMVLLTALLNRLGLSGSRGGTNMLAAMIRTIPGVFGSGLLTGKSGKALHAMDMVDESGHSKFFKDGKFDAVSWMQGLSSYVAKEFSQHPEAIARQDILKNFQFAFGTQGSRVASLLSSPQALEQLRTLANTFSKLSGTDVMQSKYANESVWQKFENAQTNFTSAMTELGWVLLPTASKWLKIVNNNLNDLTEYLHDNTSVAKGLGLAFLGLSAVMGFSGLVHLLKFSFIALVIPMRLFTVALRTFGLLFLASGPIGWTIAGISLLVLAGYEIYAHWKEIKPLLYSVWTGIKSWMSNILDWFVQKAKSIGAIVLAPMGWVAQKGNEIGTGLRAWSAPPSQNSGQNKTGNVYLDGYPVGKIVAGHMAKSMDGPATGGSGFDSHQSFVPVGVSGSW